MSINLEFFCLTLFFHTCLGVPKLSSFAKAEDKLFKYLFGNYQKWVRPVEYLNQTIRVKFGLAISQLVDVVRMEKHWLSVLFMGCVTEVLSQHMNVAGLKRKHAILIVSVLTILGREKSANDNQCVDETGK